MLKKFWTKILKKNKSYDGQIQMYSFKPPSPPKKIVKPYDFTEQICLDFTEQAQKKSLTSILSKYPKAQPKRILKKKN